MGELFRRRGYSVVETGGVGADGGVDLVLRKSSEKYLVQCKRWRATPVGVKVVRELYGLMSATGATGAFVVTCGAFSADARAFAEGRNVELVESRELLKFLPSSAPQAAPASHTTPASSTRYATQPECPQCRAQWYGGWRERAVAPGRDSGAAHAIPHARAHSQAAAIDSSGRGAAD